MFSSSLKGMEKWCKRNRSFCVVILLAVVVAFLHYDPLDMKLFDPFTSSQAASVGNQGVAAAEEMGNEGQMAVKGMDQKPATCYPQQTLKP